jgi:hypothetical protein
MSAHDGSGTTVIVVLFAFFLVIATAYLFWRVYYQGKRGKRFIERENKAYEER